MTIRKTSRKEVIIRSFCELEDKLKSIVDAAFFPSLEDYDVTDLVYYLTLIFLGITTEEQFKTKIQEILDMKEVKLEPEIITRILPIIMKFVIWLRTI